MRYAYKKYWFDFDHEELDCQDYRKWQEFQWWNQMEFLFENFDF